MKNTVSEMKHTETLLGLNVIPHSIEARAFRFRGVGPLYPLHHCDTDIMYQTNSII